MLTTLILACLAYVVLFAVLWVRTRFVARAGRTSRRARVQVTPWGKALHIEAPSEAEAVDALLRVDLELARNGR